MPLRYLHCGIKFLCVFHHLISRSPCLEPLSTSGHIRTILSNFSGMAHRSSYSDETWNLCQWQNHQGSPARMAGSETGRWTWIRPSTTVSNPLFFQQGLDNKEMHCALEDEGFEIALRSLGTSAALPSPWEPSSGGRKGVRNKGNQLVNGTIVGYGKELLHRYFRGLNVIVAR